jgi:hypothetical protein
MKSPEPHPVPPLASVGALLHRFEELLKEAAETAAEFINTDDEKPTTWDDLLQKHVRENYYRRKFRFEPP